MADDDDHFFSLGFFKNGIHALVRCLLAWDGIQHRFFLFLSEKSAPKIPPQLDEVEEGER
jgi:hypothetical protein